MVAQSGAVSIYEVQRYEDEINQLAAKGNQLILAFCLNYTAQGREVPEQLLSCSSDWLETESKHGILDSQLFGTRLRRMQSVEAYLKNGGILSSSQQFQLRSEMRSWRETAKATVEDIEEACEVKRSLDALEQTRSTQPTGPDDGKTVSSRATLTANLNRIHDLAFASLNRHEGKMPVKSPKEIGKFTPGTEGVSSLRREPEQMPESSAEPSLKDPQSGQNSDASGLHGSTQPEARGSRDAPDVSRTLDVATTGAPLGKQSRPHFATATQGKIEKLLIWLQQPSSIMGQPVSAQIALGTQEGKSLVADRDYPFSLACQGCSVQPITGLIRKGDREAAASLSPSARYGKLAASAVGLEGATAPISGCIVGKRPSDVLVRQPQSVGRVGDVLPFWLDLVDDDGNLVQAGKNQVLYSYEMAGVRGIVVRNSMYGVDDEIGSIPVNQCEEALAITSKEVGSASVMIRPLRLKPKSVAFSFVYGFPRIDLIAALAGLILGTLGSRFVVNRRRASRLRWYWVLLSGSIGSLIFFVLGTYSILNRFSINGTSMWAMGLSIAGAIVGAPASSLIKTLVTSNPFRSRS